MSKTRFEDKVLSALQNVELSFGMDLGIEVHKRIQTEDSVYLVDFALNACRIALEVCTYRSNFEEAMFETRRNELKSAGWHLFPCWDDAEVGVRVERYIIDKVCNAMNFGG